MTTIISQCVLCQHFIASDREHNRCKAYPDAIPDAILINEKDHRVPRPGDHGIQWAPRQSGDEHPLGPQEKT